MAFMPHGMCYLWQLPMLVAQVTADALCAIAYLAVATFLVWAVRTRRDIPFSWALVAFALFIVSCGATHVMSIVVIWHPFYWTEAAVKWLTAVASVTTAILLVPLAPRVLALRSPAQLFAMNQELEATLAERDRLAGLAQAAEVAIGERNAAVEAAMVKSRFVGMVSHELRTPLNGIMGMTELLQLNLPPGKMFEYTAHIRRSAHTLLQIVDDLLIFSRADSGKIELNAETVDLQGLVAGLIDVHREDARRRGIALDAIVPVGMPLVIGDRLRIEQIIGNLLSNAMRFTHAGSVRVRLSLESLGNGVFDATFAVSDTGIGIPEHAHERIFEAFHQMDMSNARKYGGTGLGLPIARHLAHIMSGTLTVESSEGQGSTFTFRVPLRAAETSNSETEQIATM